MTEEFLLPADFSSWIAGAANELDTGIRPAADVLPRLVAARLVGVGVPVALGGTGGDTSDAVRAIAAVAQESLTAAFMLWGHRSYVEYLLQTPNKALAKRHLAAVLAGQVAGASGLSNAMKSLAGLEKLQVRARSDGADFILNGKLPWVTNLRPAGFHVAAAIDREDGGPAFVAFLAHDDAGLTRSADLDIMGMRSSDTAALTFENVRIGKDRILAENADAWLSAMKPSFIALQCGMSIGLARRALAEAAKAATKDRGSVRSAIASVRDHLDRAEAELLSGLSQGRFVDDAARLFELRIEFAAIVADATGLELQATGGRAYLTGPGRDFARRWRESAFIPLVTPSLTQMQTALLELRQAA
jgi:alkylation response protein AidB-like acyl-CoA dehydrogenase